MKIYRHKMTMQLYIIEHVGIPGSWYEAKNYYNGMLMKNKCKTKAKQFSENDINKLFEIVGEA